MASLAQKNTTNMKHHNTTFPLFHFPLNLVKEEF